MGHEELVDCNQCGGAGFWDDGHVRERECDYCYGTGQVPISVPEEYYPEPSDYNSGIPITTITQINGIEEVI